MEILVCVKQVPDADVEVKLNADGKPNVDSIAPVVNAFDGYALEMATRFKAVSYTHLTAKTGDKPGVTKGKQWIRIKKDFELLDTPGILWPKFEDEEVGLKLAMIGSINDNILDTETLCTEYINLMMVVNPNFIKNRYCLLYTSRCV